MKKPYVIGVDCGTNSVGISAVYKDDFEKVEINGKILTDVTVFEAGDTAKKTRLSRSSRRRLSREKQREEILKELIGDEVQKVDPRFFDRLNESFLQEEDRSDWNQGKNSLFADEGYTDADFYKEFPTIYDLKKAFLDDNIENLDERHLFLVVKHELDHRGHFLIAGTVDDVLSFNLAFTSFSEAFFSLTGEEIKRNEKGEEDERKTFKSVMEIKAKKEKTDAFLEKFKINKTEKQNKAAVGLLCGSKVNLATLFNDEKLKDIEEKNFGFEGIDYEEKRPELEIILGERISFIDAAHALWNWNLLDDIMRDKKTITDAMLWRYKKYKTDLKKLKTVMKELLSKEDYEDFFKNDKKGIVSYTAYTKKTFIKKSDSNKVSKSRSVNRVSELEFFEYIHYRLKGCLEERSNESKEKKEQRKADAEARRNLSPEVSALADEIVNDIENDIFLKKQRSVTNGIIPMQLHEKELKTILKNAEKKFTFLTEIDEENGLTKSEKILKLFSFHIPYYVGPLNENSKHGWIVRKEAGKIYPWNFEDKVNTAATAERFIARMRNSCTYLAKEEVLPKQSLMYTRFTVLNELNNIKIFGKRLPVDVKQNIFHDLFENQKTVTKTSIKNYLKKANDSVYEKIEVKDITGMSKDEFTSSLESYLFFKNLFGNKIEEKDILNMAEDLINWSALFGNDENQFEKIIREKYSEEELSSENLKKVLKKRFKEWGKLSKKFLSELFFDHEGEKLNILNILYYTEFNLQEIISRYHVQETLDKINSELLEKELPFNYESLLENEKCSPAVKRPVWQTLKSIKRIVDIMGYPPEAIYLESTRTNKAAKVATVSRKKFLLDTYEKIIKKESKKKKETNEIAELAKIMISEVNKYEVSNFKDNNLYLYFLQMGKSVYTGKRIDFVKDKGLYDKDHIFPQSMVTDDSIENNRVLVEKALNNERGNNIVPETIRKEQEPFWKELVENGLMTKEKYSRLTRSIEFNVEELTGFIERQLVETSQTVAMVRNSLEKTELKGRTFFLKAEMVSILRGELKAVKSRELNNYHHADDAYLTAVAGIVHTAKFTNNPYNWIKAHKNDYHVSRLFEKNVKNISGETVWIAGENGSAVIIKQNLKKKRNHVIRTALCRHSGQNGGFFNNNIVRKDNNATVPIKKGLDVKKYGGYKSITITYFILITYDNPGYNKDNEKSPKRLAAVVPIPLVKEKELSEDNTVFLKYCEEVWGYKNPEKLRVLKPREVFTINGYPLAIAGVTGNSMKMLSAAEPLFNENTTRYLNKIFSYYNRNKERPNKKINYLPITKDDGITREENFKLYLNLIRKLETGIFKKRPKTKQLIKSLKENIPEFKKLSVEKQAYSLYKVFCIFSTNSANPLVKSEIGLNLDSIGLIQIPFSGYVLHGLSLRTL